MISRRRFLTFSSAAAATGLLGAADAFALEPGYSLAVRHWTVPHADWPESEPPLRIGIMTDIHAVEPWMSASRIASIARRLNSLKPDVIVLLGDFMSGLPRRFRSSHVPISDWTGALKELSAPQGVYAVLGNHDMWSQVVPAIRRGFEDADITLLENAAVPVERGGSRFWIAGLGDQLDEADDLPGTLRQVKGTGPVILLAHEPYIFPKVPERVALTLSGHTHGGQVYIPFLGRPAIPHEYAQFAYGHVQRGSRHMIVSAGLGVTAVPVRFLVPPEIAVVTLCGAAGA